MTVLTGPLSAAQCRWLAASRRWRTQAILSLLMLGLFGWLLILLIQARKATGQLA